ncbi:lipopolysaccharide biosynthesis protein [Pontibacter qinzhouensis]|uniref:Lipopolysaccharide biosynthesis protein n=1 Tax=Pontibacter qinzhouensis TaxID=2603253 RepID=A0A5C8IIU5_9BACT|nr:lipopolysaccharide biosynthesis protein [Pontibacter qinzhouensis]TXK20964.1 lipopolysaccharide biosynthesis protein [Pontibacter qinzhouensis]
MLRKLLSDAAIYGLAAQLPRLAGVITLPLLTQYLTSADYGVAGVVIAYNSALGMLQSLGLVVVLGNLFSKFPLRYKWAWRQINGFLSVWSFFYGIVMGAIIYWIVPPEADAYRLQIAVLHALPIMLFASTEIQAMHYHLLSQRPLPIGIRAFVIGCVGVSMNVYTIAYLQLGFMGWFYANFLGALAGFLINAYHIYLKQGFWPIFNFKWHRIKSSLKMSLPVIPHNFSSFLMDTSDRLVLDMLQVPIPKIGLYNVASSLGSHFLMATHAIVQASSPYYMRYFGKEASQESALQARRLTFILQAFFLVITFVCCLWVKEIFVVLIRNKELQQAYPLAIVILMAYNYRPMYMAVTSLLVYRDQASKLWKISAVGGLGNVVLNFIFIPLFGYKAAAFTTFVALMYMGFGGYFLPDYKKVKQVDYYPLYWMGLTVATFALAYNLVELALAYKAFITVMVLGVAAIAAFQLRNS